MDDDKVLYFVVLEAIKRMVDKDKVAVAGYQGLDFDMVCQAHNKHITFKVNENCRQFRIVFTDDGCGIKNIVFFGGSEMKSWFQRIFGGVFEIYHE